MSKRRQAPKRRWRGVGAGALAALLLSLYVGAAASAHQPFAGDWNTAYNGASVFDAEGHICCYLNFQHVSQADGARALRDLGGSPCRAPSDYFTGYYSTNEPDSGRLAACTVSISCVRMVGVYRSSSDGGPRGTFTIGLQTSFTSWSGSYTVSGGTGGTWLGVLANHYAGDGADAPCAASSPQPKHRKHHTHHHKHKRH